MKFVPFVWISLFLCAGIAFAEFVSIPLWIGMTVLVLIMASFFLIERLNISVFSPFSKTLLLFAAVFLCGVTLYEQQKPEKQPGALAQLPLPNDHLLGSIVSISRSASGYAKCEFRLQAILRQKDSLFHNELILLIVDVRKKGLKAGDLCEIATEVKAIRNTGNPGEFDAEYYWRHKGIRYMAFAPDEAFVVCGRVDQSWTTVFDRWRAYFASVLEKHLTGDQLGVAKALILGDRSSLDAEITAQFGNTGAMHVLAVSGLHVGILVQILTYLLSLFSRWISKKQALMLALTLVWIYALMTGFSASVARSALMFSILAGGTLFNRISDSFNVLAFSAFVILIWNPHFLFDIGFQLSYLAMLGIFMFYKPLSKVWVAPWKWLRVAFEGTMVGIAAQIMTLPLTLYYFHQFPNYFILTNLGLMVFSFLILALGIGLFASQFWLFLAKILAWLLALSLFLMLFIVDWIDGLPGAVATGFMLNPILVISLFGVSLLCYCAIQFQKLQLLRYTLLAASLVLFIIVGWRYRQMTLDQLCFYQAPGAVISVKWNNKICFFYDGSKKNLRKKTKLIAAAYLKVCPGEVRYFDLHGYRKSVVSDGAHRIEIVRHKGGFALNLDKQHYFLATSMKYLPSHKTLVFASWVQVKKPFRHLRHGAVVFDL